MANRDRFHDDSNLSGDYARDTWRGGFGGDWAREGGLGHEFYGGGPGMRGGFRGRGPKNYRRPDPRIAEEIHERLTDDHYVDATHIVVRVENGHVTLSGTVNDRREKRRAEDVVDSCTGVTDVTNELRVEHRDEERRLGKGSE